MADTPSNPAIEAAERARASMEACLNEGRSFVFEAGAGAGKTTSLVEAIRYIVNRRGREFAQKQQRIACITYTNVATAEIESRIDRHPLAQVSTIHAFCWSLIEPFQAFMRAELPTLSQWPERLVDIGDIGTRRVQYNLGHPRLDPDTVWLHHNDVLSLATKLLAQEKFRTLLFTRFPAILIDEYQDTDAEFASALLTNVAPSPGPLLLGLFGDHWQKIYGNGCGHIREASLARVDKGANFRSAPVIVSFLNAMRPELQQAPKNPQAVGSVQVFHTNNWVGTRQTGQHWGGDLPALQAHQYLDQVRQHLRTQGWTFEPASTKVLMLTNRVLAAEQGYGTVLGIFPYADSVVKADDPHIGFLVNTVEQMCGAYERRKYGEMFQVIGDRTPAVFRPSDKAAWGRDLDALMALRQTGTIGAVLDHIRGTGRPQMPESVEKRERAIERGIEADSDDPEELTRIQQLRSVQYTEIVALARYINDQTPFSTKHGVKGAEFENVLAVFGRGWNQYNFGQMLELHPNVPNDKRDAYERSRNLFYVACSRPQTRLAVLFTQQLSQTALKTLAQWCGDGAITALPVL